MKDIHPLSIVHSDAQIGENVTIGPFTTIEKDVVIGDNTWIGPNVTIFNGARLGKNVQVFPGAVVAGIPQDLKFNGETTTAEVGDFSVIREMVTINRGTAAAGATRIGKHCLIMAYAHVAHDCVLGDRVVLANNVNLAGHVEIEDWAILEGLVAVQQFCRVGAHSFIAGGSLVRKHVPPFVKAAREPLSYVGVNSIGLQRRNFASEQIHQIHDIYRILFVSGYRMSKAIEVIEQNIPPSPERDLILDFVHKQPEIMRGLRHMNGKTVHDEN
jgi:UDP-N-acetylglucosamine acyltransferase